MKSSLQILAVAATVGAGSIAVSATVKAAEAGGCSEVQCGATYSGERLLRSDNIQYSGDQAISWDCVYADGTVLHVSCTPGDGN